MKQQIRMTLSVSLISLMSVLSACSSNNDDTPSPTPRAPNELPTAAAGDDQSANKDIEVTLDGSGSFDSDGTITSYQWTQTGGLSVTLTNSDMAEATFIAPEVTSTEVLTFELAVTDNGGATSTDIAEVTIEETALLISLVTPSFAPAGSTITIEASRELSSEVKVFISGVSVPLTTVDGNTITLDIPADSVSGPIQVKDGLGSTNQIFFNVSEEGLIAADPDTLIDDVYVSNYLIVKLKEGESTLVNAQRVASLISSTVVGRNSDLRWWQISTEAASLEELNTLSEILRSDIAVERVSIDAVALDELVDWSADPDLGEQRDRNNVEEGVTVYETNVSTSDPEKVLPFFMSIGVSERGLDFELPDFTGYAAENIENADTNISIFSNQADSSVTESSSGNHGSNVVGLIAAEFADGGNAGILSGLASSHSGANLKVSSGSGSVAGRLNQSLEVMKQGANVVNWSWGLHRRIVDTSGVTPEVTDGAINCDGDFIGSHATISNQVAYDDLYDQLDDFFEVVSEKYPSVVIVASAGNASTDSGSVENRIPTSIISDQLIVVGAHTSGAEGEDVSSAGRCFDEDIETDVKRADYSSYGNRVDISASGSIVGFENTTLADKRGTSYAAPVVTSTVALMQSVNPNLTPSDIKRLIRTSALPIENKVLIDGEDDQVFTRALTEEESEDNAGQGARLNVEGAIQAAIDSLDDETLELGDRVNVEVGEEQVTQTIEVTIPSDDAVFDKVDIMFLVDVSGSYSDDLSTFRSQATELIDSFGESGDNVQIGLSSFSDFPQSPYGSSSDYAFQLDQPLSSDLSLLETALNSLSILSGNDSPESQLEGLFQTAQAESGWRDGALPIIFLATDASFHDSDSETGYPGAGYTDTLAALNELKATVFGLQSGGSIADVIKVVNDTDGQAFSLSRDSSEIIEAVNSAIDSTDENISINLVPSGDFSGSVVSIVPTLSPSDGDGAAIEDVNPGDTVSFDVTFSKGTFTSGEHTFVFRLLVNADDVAVIQEIPVVLTIN